MIDGIAFLETHALPQIGKTGKFSKRRDRAPTSTWQNIDVRSCNDIRLSIPFDRTLRSTAFFSSRPHLVRIKRLRMSSGAISVPIPLLLYHFEVVFCRLQHLRCHLDSFDKLILGVF